jgi:hypothetical protein
MGFEPTTFCMASRRSSQLSYSRSERTSIGAADWGLPSTILGMVL